MKDFSSRLELVANVCLIGASLAVVAAVGMNLWKANVQRFPDAAYSIGDDLPPLGTLNYSEVEKTLFLVVSSNCKYCVQSMPFYARLAASRRAPKSLRIVVAGAESEESLRSLAAKHALDPDEVVSLERGALRVRGTPTIILANRQGRVIGYWAGLLLDREKEVLSALER